MLKLTRWTLRGMQVGVLMMGVAAHSQKPAVTDSAMQASPITAPPKAPVDDSAVQASPAVGPSTKGVGPVFAAKTAIPIKLLKGVDSGQLKNGDTVPAMLSAAVDSMPAGTPVQLSVIATVPAGKLNAAGEMSLQVVRVGRAEVATDTQTFRGTPGPKDVADAAPKKGSDASLDNGATLTFHVLAPPVPLDAAPKGGVAPGSVMPR